MHRPSRYLFLIALIFVLVACGSPSAGSEPDARALEALPTETARQATPEPTPTRTSAPTAEAPAAGAPTAEAANTPTAAAPAAGAPTAEAANAPAPAPPTTVPSATPAQSAPVAPLSAGDVQRITPAEARSLLESGGAVLYDARSRAAYDALHAVGALSFPEAEAAARLGELPADKSLIFY